MLDLQNIAKIKLFPCKIAFFDFQEAAQKSIPFESCFGERPKNHTGAMLPQDLGPRTRQHVLDTLDLLANWEPLNLTTNQYLEI